MNNSNNNDKHAFQILPIDRDYATKIASDPGEGEDVITFEEVQESLAHDHEVATMDG